MKVGFAMERKVVRRLCTEEFIFVNSRQSGLEPRTTLFFRVYFTGSVDLNNFGRRLGLLLGTLKDILVG